MTNLFSLILNMSMTGSLVILLVILARLALKKAPKIYSYALWAVVLFRLLCPVSLSVPVSVLDVLKPQVSQSEGIATSVSYIPAEFTREEQPRMEELPQVGTPEARVDKQPGSQVPLITMTSWIWLMGAAVMILRSLVQYAQLRLRLVGAFCCGGNLYIADHITTPFVMGIVNPKIYLPSEIPAKERRYILAHERHHIRRGDHIVKLLAYGALCLHWFNPLVWVAFILAGKDMEMSCDEAVVRRYGSKIRADYSASLLRLATGQRIFSGMPIAFGEGDTKGRILNMANWRKPKIWVSLISCVLCIAILAACAVNPQQEATEQTQTMFDKVSLALPQGFALEANEDGTYSISDGSQSIGGLAKRELPDPGITTADMAAWVKSVGVPEAQDSGMACMIEGSSYCTLEANFFPDVPDREQAIAGEVTHYLYQQEDAVYDLWFWEARTNNEVKWYILERLAPTGNDTAKMQKLSVDLVSEFRAELPEGYRLVNNGDGTRSIVYDIMTMVGGIEKYPAPNMDMDDMAAWVKALGVPEIQDGVMSYMMEDYGGPYAFQAHFFNEFVDEQERAATETVHYFFVNGDIVYDVWFYYNKIEDTARKKILDSAGFLAEAETVPDSAAKEPVQGNDVATNISVEQINLEKCRGVLELVQSGSCQLAVIQEHGNPPALWSRAEFFQSGEDWLKIVDIDPETENIADGEQYSVRMAFLHADGVRYSNEGNWGKAYTDIKWAENSSFNDDVKPWLAGFRWNDQVVYMGTQPEDTGYCVMLRVDEHYAGREDYAPNYFVNFHFDAQGNFLQATIEVNLYRDDAFTETESIVSTDSEIISKAIEAEYSRTVS